MKRVFKKIKYFLQRRKTKKVESFNKFEPRGILTTVFKGSDEIDNYILNNITNPFCFELDLLNACFWGNKENYDKFFGHVKDLTNSLFKANDHRRKYLNLEKESLQKFKKDCEKDQNGSADISYNAIDLFNEIDAFFIQIKSALDSLAKTLNPLFGFTLQGWSSKKDPNNGYKKSGILILNALRENLSRNLKEKNNKIIDFLEKNTSWITYLVILRDNPVHRGGSKNITPVIYRREIKDVVPPTIFHPDQTNELMADFLTRTIREISEFFHVFLRLVSELKAPDLIIIKTQRDQQSIYQWAIPKDKLK